MKKENKRNDYEETFFNSPKNLSNSDFILQGLNNLRRITLDKKSHIKDYYKIRKMHQKIVNSMIDYHQSDKFKLKIDVDNIYEDGDLSNIKESLHLIETGFNLETREGTQGLYDLLIYKNFPDMNSITEDFIKSHRYRKPEKIEFLHSMLDSTIGLFEITKTDIHEGYAYLKEVFTGKEYQIVDIGLSGNRNYDSIYIYSRLIKYHNITFNTGLNLLFNKKDGFMKKHIKKHKKNYSTEGELLRFAQLYKYYSENPNRMKVHANNIL